MRHCFTTQWIAPDDTLATGTDAADRFRIFGTEASEVAVIANFELGADVLRFAGSHGPETFPIRGHHHHHRYRADLSDAELSWVDHDGDGTVDDLLLSTASRSVVLTDLAHQLGTAPIVSLHQGFEDDTGGWVDEPAGWFGTATQTASGTDGIVSARGDFHIRLTGDEITAPYHDLLGRGTIPFEPFTVSLEIYLDPAADGAGWTDGEGFDYAVAATVADEDPARSFYFNVAQDSSTGQMLLAAGTLQNPDFVPREDLETVPGAVVIDQDGWYRFEHRMHETEAGNLAVDMTVLNAADEIVFQTTLETPDPVTLASGDPRYAYFELIGVAGGIAVDELRVIYDSAEAPPLPDLADLFYL